MTYTQPVARIFLALFITFSVVFGITTSVTNAQQTTNTAQMAELLERIQELQAQIKALQEQQAGLRAQVQEAVQLTRSLARGMSGEDVRALQELLATDNELYPEGLITGFYGPMTERAVQKLQARFGIDQVGTVGPMTQRTLNELFKHDKKERGNALKAVLIELKDDDNVDFSQFQPGVKNVLICHIPGGNVSKRHTIAVGGPAVQAHLGHGDTLGRCDTENGDDDDDNEDDQTTRGEAQDAIDDAEDAISDAQDAIDDAEDADLDTEVAEELLAEARELLADAEDAFDDKDYDDAKEFANDAEETADEAREEAEDAE
jgi:peptidoglycan hydrolase-like protein with peptidoglycan-binding domain